jgi:hypothetical protein
MNRNNLFTDSSLIHQILVDEETKRDLSKKSPMTMFKQIKCKNQTGLTNRKDKQYQINEDNRNPLTTPNIHRFCLATSNKFRIKAIDNFFILFST